MIRLVVELPSLATEIRALLAQSRRAAGRSYISLTLSQSKQERKEWREGGNKRLTGRNNVVETGDSLLADAVGGGAEETAKVEVGAGQVAGHASAAFGRPRAGWQLDHARRTVKQPTKVERAGRVGVQVAADAGLLVTRHAVHSVLARPAERSIYRRRIREETQLQFVRLTQVWRV